MAGLVVGRARSLEIRNGDSPFRAQKDALQRGVEVVSKKEPVASVSRCAQGRLVDEILQVRSDHSGRQAGHSPEVNGGVERYLPGVHGEDPLAPGSVGGANGT